MKRLTETHAYDDIIHLPHPVSAKHRPMPLSDRAAQFAPFAALTGYEAVIRETGRLTDPQLELTEGEKAVLNDRLQRLQDVINTLPEARFLIFQPDARKSGGAYVKITGRVKKIDVYRQMVVLEDRKELPMAQIIAIEIADTVL